MRFWLFTVVACVSGCVCPGMAADGGPVDAGTTDAAVADGGSGDGGRIDGGVLQFISACFSRSGPAEHFATRLSSAQYNLCAELLFRADAGALVPGAQGPPGYGLVDSRYGLCTAGRLLNDGGLDQRAPRLDAVTGTFEWTGSVSGVPVIFAARDGSATFAGAAFTIEADPISIDFGCPGD